MNPKIPTHPCVKCGVPTNETASVHGVMHDQCYRDYSPNKVGEHIDAALADHMSGKPMPGWKVPKATHQVKVGITIHTTSDSSADDWYSNTVAAGVGMLQGRSFKPGLIMGSTTDNQTHVMAEFEVPMLSTMLAPEPATTLQPHQQRRVDEHSELLERLRKLRAFIGDAKGPFRQLDDAERHRLMHPEDVMTELATVLAERVAAFQPAPVGDDFPLGKACDLSGEGTCEACQ